MDFMALEEIVPRAHDANLAAPAHAHNHLDEVGVTEEHRLLEVPVAVPEPVALPTPQDEQREHLETDRLKELRACREAGQPAQSTRTDNC